MDKELLLVGDCLACRKQRESAAPAMRVPKDFADVRCRSRLAVFLSLTTSIFVSVSSIGQG